MSMNYVSVLIIHDIMLNLVQLLFTIQRISTRETNKLCFPVDSDLSMGNITDHLNN